MRQFDKLTASYLFCKRCNRAMPVRERLLLVLMDGELYDFQCVRCGSSLGERKVSQSQTAETRIILP